MEHEQQNKIERLIARSWADEAFRQAMLADPLAILREAGIGLPPDMEVQVVEDSEKVVNLVLPWPTFKLG